jgi:flagella synthesis protein FlgN
VPTTALDILRAEIDGYGTLLGLLAREADVLRRAEGEALPALTAAKLEQVGALQALARARAVWVDGIGCADTSSALAVALGSAAEAAAARTLWTTLLALARQARHANEVNGRLIERQRQHFQGALAALMGAAGLAPVYGADGRPRPAPATRSLASI